MLLIRSIWKELRHRIYILQILTILTFVDKENPFFGYVSSLERALEIVRDYEIATTTKFTVYTKTKHFGAACKLHAVLRANI